VLFSHKEECMSFAEKWMELEIFMLSEISPTEVVHVLSDI
jgi:hypothetical protein